MRAKEYIACSEASLKYPAEIKQIVADMLPLHASREQTVDYYNKHLIPDIRRQGYLLQKDLYDKNNAMQTEAPEPFQMNAGELPVEIASEVRDELFAVIKEDKSFGHLYSLLGNLRNSLHPSNPIDCVPDEQEIKTALFNQRDDYPKASLADYLDDDINFAQYQDLTEAGITDEAKLLEWFNNAYRIYDEMRLVKTNPISAVKIFLEDNSYDSQESKDLTGNFICEIIAMMGGEDKRLDRIKEELLRHLPDEATEASSTKSKFHLKNKKGRKTDFVRVMNVLLEMGFFTDADGDQAKKAEFFQALGKLLNENFKDYQNLLSTTKGASVADQKALTKIFEDMLDKQKSIISK